MSDTINGYIVIADISGYTMFLSESELEHAQAILQSLLEIMIQQHPLAVDYLAPGRAMRSSATPPRPASCKARPCSRWSRAAT